MSEPAAASPKRLGDFEIVREIGRGGMGVVYEAWQSSLKRRVALKVLSGQLGLTSQAVVRFRREAEAAAKLHHTNIVPIYATGEQDGTHYYAMELIEGPSLAVVIRALRPRGSEATRQRGERRPLAAGPAGDAAPTSTGDGVGTLPPWVMETIAGPRGAPAESEPQASRRAGRGPGTRRSRSRLVDDSSTLLTGGGGYFDTIARLIGEVADALDYAHQQGVIHRDIKPSNLLLSCVGPVCNRSVGGVDRLQTGSTSKPGKLSINDFGLARVLEQPGMTLTGDFLGTPRYMSPEQIAAGRAPLDHRTDIYSLGATLYELLTLQPPFPGERREQVIAQIIGKDPVPPRRLNKRVPVDLETICLKALEKDPDRRYQTAGQMAEDLRKYVNRFAISAKRAGLIARAIKWARRRPVVAVLLAVVIVVTAAAGVFALGAHRAQVRMVEIQRQKAMDDALLAAMSGNFEHADAAIRQAEALGASTGWTRVLQGLAWLQKGENEKAISDLEQAVRLLPTSVAARSLLAHAHDRARNIDRTYALLAEIDQLSPVSAVDYLFKGSVESGIEPTHGMQSLDEAVRRRPNWSLAYAVRASARTERAMMSGRPEDAQLALDDARIAKSMLPNNTLASQVSLYAHLVAANVFSDVGDEASRAPALAEAGQDARALESATGSAAVQQLRAQYFEQVGMDDAALAEYQRTSQSTGKATNYASALYRRGAFVEAFKALEGVRVPAPDMVLRMYRACVVMELEDGYQRALEMFHQMMARPSQGVYALDPPWIPLLLGRQAEAVAAAQQSRERVAQMPPWMFEWYRHLLDYQCDMISAEELLAAAAGSRLHQCEAHFHIGLGLLAEGDRTGAREHFSAAVQTHVFVYYEYVWSRNFLARLEQDPTWPPWISVKEGNEATRQQGDETVPGTQPGDPEP